MQKVIGVTILATANAEKCPLTCSGVCKDPTKLDCAKDQWGCVQFAKGCDEDCDDPKFVLTASFNKFPSLEASYAIFMDLFMNRRYCKVNTDGCWAVQQTIAHKEGHRVGLHDFFHRWMGSSRASRQKHNSSS